MKILIFGLTISSSWGNGHATLWRGLCKALARDGHRIMFFERDVPYYAGARDGFAAPGFELQLYPEWSAALPLARRHCADADIAIVTSYCPDALAASQLIFDSGRPLSVFYDLDTPVTLAALRRGENVFYIGADGLREFDLVLSYTGGAALTELQERLGARRVRPLYGHVDPEVHQPAQALQRYAADLSYLGTYAEDRQQTLHDLFIVPAQRSPARRFLIGGAQYPEAFPWTENIYFVRHLPPEEHPAFFSSSRCTLNVTRRAMAEMGWCPSGRLFEAAACGAAMLSDRWPGLEDFYTPDEEILVVHSAADTLAALDMDDGQLRRIGAAARERSLSEHTSTQRAKEMLAFCAQARCAAALPIVPTALATSMALES